MNDVDHLGIIELEGTNVPSPEVAVALIFLVAGMLFAYWT